jgi:hypothetical protein
VIYAQPSGEAAPRFELRLVRKLTPTDVLQVSDDPRLFRVLGVVTLTGPFSGRCKVLLRALDGTAEITLIRAGGDSVQVLLRPAGPSRA